MTKSHIFEQQVYRTIHGEIVRVIDAVDRRGTVIVSSLDHTRGAVVRRIGCRVIQRVAMVCEIPEPRILRGMGEYRLAARLEKHHPWIASAE